MSYIRSGGNVGVWSGDYVMDGMGRVITQAAPRGSRRLTRAPGGGGPSISLPKVRKDVYVPPSWVTGHYYKGWQIQQRPNMEILAKMKAPPSGSNVPMLYRAVKGRQVSPVFPMNERVVHQWVDKLEAAPLTTATTNRPVIIRRQAVTIQEPPPIR